MKKEELSFILQEGEGLKIEFKENFDSKSLAKEIVAFANSEGGRIFMGIDDKGKIRGINITNKLKSEIQDISNNCDPPIKIEISEIENIIIVNVFEGTDKPYKCREGFFVRIGPNSQKMKRDDIIEMIFSLGKIRFDEQKTNVHDYDYEILKTFLKKAGIDKRPDKATLFNLGVMDEKGKLNNAGILFFNKNPKKYLINAYVTCVRYKGIEKVDVIDRKDFEEDLVTQVEQAMEFIKRNTRVSYKIKELRREDIPEYPIEAIREALLNAVMHRDYSEKGADVQVDIYDDRLTITNIGGLIKPLTKEKLGTIAVRRNPLIAELFHRINYVERIGSGIKKINDECKKHGGVDFEVDTNGYFIAIFMLKKDTVKDTVKDLTENERKILNQITMNSRVSSEELSKLIGINLRNIKKNIYKLKQRGILKRIGPDKGGNWEIIKDKNKYMDENYLNP